MRLFHTRLGRSQALRTYFLFLEIRHKVELHQMTGRVAECPVDEMNRPRGAGRAALRIPPSAVQVAALFAGWRAELATCRKYLRSRSPATLSHPPMAADVGHWLRTRIQGGQCGEPGACPRAQDRATARKSGQRVAVGLDHARLGYAVTDLPG